MGCKEHELLIVLNGIEIFDGGCHELHGKAF